LIAKQSEIDRLKIIEKNENQLNNIMKI